MKNKIFKAMITAFVISACASLALTIFVFFTVTLSGLLTLLLGELIGSLLGVLLSVFIALVVVLTAWVYDINNINDKYNENKLNDK